MRTITSKVAAIAALLAFVAGVAARVALYADRRSLWLDEAWIAINIATRSFLALLRPLDYAQAAPVGFLWTERLATDIGGVNDLALRFFPLVLGCVLLVAFWRLAARLLDEPTAALGMAFVALAPLLIYYSSEVKPYGSDALVAVVLMWLTLDVLEAPDSAARWNRLLAGGVVGILCSTPSAFVLAGAGAALVLDRTVRNSASARGRLFVLGGVWAAVFAVGYLTLYRGAANSAYMQRIWQGRFLSLPPRRLLTGAHDATRTLWLDAVFGDEQALVLPKTIVIAMLSSALGLVAVARRRGLATAALLAVPIAAVGAASLAHRWPLAPRLLLFVVPTLLLLLLAGLRSVAELLPARARVPALVLFGAVLLVPSVRYDLRTLRTPNRHDDAAPLIRTLATTRANRAIVYVIRHAAPSWFFYTARWDRRDAPAFRVGAARVDVSAEYPTRACVEDEAGRRVVYSPLDAKSLSDSTLAREAAWLVVQPEREIWVLTLNYERDAGRRMDQQLLARGAERTEMLTRQEADLRRYRLVGSAPVATVGCTSNAP